MGQRTVYLAKYRLNRSQRAHFALFIPNIGSDCTDLELNFRSVSCKGTVINVVGEPVIAGFILEIKRNYDCSSSPDLEKVVSIGHVDETNLHEPESDKEVIGDIPRGRLEREAASLPPPRGGQNVRLPVDGITTRRCQEWTMDYLAHLVERGLINKEAIFVIQEERDPPDHGLFGQHP